MSATGIDQVLADNYLAAGITDDLTTELSHIPVAFVISHATAWTIATDQRELGSTETGAQPVACANARPIRMRST